MLKKGQKITYYLKKKLKKFNTTPLKQYQPLPAGFSMFQVSLQAKEGVEQRTILMGLTSAFNLLSEYRHKKSEAIELFNMQKSVMRFALC